VSQITLGQVRVGGSDTDLIGRDRQSRVGRRSTPCLQPQQAQTAQARDPTCARPCM
jgi:hypothetical protein